MSEQELTALIVDDEQTMRSLLAKLLHQCGCSVIGHADNGKDGYQQFTAREPDIVFLDINMPRQNGMELLEKIRAENSDVHICMVSADAFAENVKRAAELGVDGFVVKPVTLERIEKVIQRIRLKRESE